MRSEGCPHPNPGYDQFNKPEPTNLLASVRRDGDMSTWGRRAWGAHAPMGPASATPLALPVSTQAEGRLTQ